MNIHTHPAFSRKNTNQQPDNSIPLMRKIINCFELMPLFKGHVKSNINQVRAAFERREEKERRRIIRSWLKNYRDICDVTTWFRNPHSARLDSLLSQYNQTIKKGRTHFKNTRSEAYHLTIWIYAFIYSSLYQEENWNIATMQEYRDYIYSEKGGQNSEKWFRGENNSAYGLCPSILHQKTDSLPSGTYCFLDILKNMPNSSPFLATKHLRTLGKNNWSDFLCYCQHYHDNSPLIDFTSEPKCAFSFAAYGSPDTDGIIQVIQTKWVPSQNQAFVKACQKTKIIVLDGEPISPLTIVDEQPFYLLKPSFFLPRCVVVSKPAFGNKRMKRQGGRMVFFYKAVYFWKRLAIPVTTGFRQSRITIKRKVKNDIVGEIANKDAQYSYKNLMSD